MANEGVPLTCWQARGGISEYVDGGLDPAERSLLEAHLARMRHLPAPLCLSARGPGLARKTARSRQRCSTSACPANPGQADQRARGGRTAPPPPG